MAVRYLEFLLDIDMVLFHTWFWIKLYVFKIGFDFTSLSDIRHSLIWRSDTACFHCWLKLCLGPNMSISYSFESSVTLEIQFGKPFSCNLSNSLYTCSVTLVSDIRYNRLKKHNKDMWQNTLGGYRPHSPITMIFEVVAFTFKTQGIYFRKNSINFFQSRFFMTPYTAVC